VIKFLRRHLKGHLLMKMNKQKTKIISKICVLEMQKSIKLMLPCLKYNYINQKNLRVKHWKCLARKRRKKNLVTCQQVVIEERILYYLSMNPAGYRRR
jgi:type II secretory pathway component PulJ